MTTLKEEFEARKKIEQTKKLVQTFSTLNEEYIIYEAIDVNQLEQMAHAVTQMDNIFSNPTIKNKIPTLAKAFDLATKDMENFTTMAVGNSSGAQLIANFAKNKLNNPITKSMSLITALSKFFGQEVPAIVKAFRIDKLGDTTIKFANQNDQNNQNSNSNAHNEKTQPMPAVQVSETYSPINLKGIGDAFSKALKPSGLLGFFGFNGTPYVKGLEGQIAQELLNLTGNELLGIHSQVQGVKTPISSAAIKDLVKTTAAGKSPIVAKGGQQGEPQQTTASKPLNPFAGQGQSTQTEPTPTQQATPNVGSAQPHNLSLTQKDVNDRLEKAGVQPASFNAVKQVLKDLGFTIT